MMEKWIISDKIDPRAGKVLDVVEVDGEKINEKNKNNKTTFAWLNNYLKKNNLYGFKYDSYKKYFKLT